MFGYSQLRTILSIGIVLLSNRHFAQSNSTQASYSGTFKEVPQNASADSNFPPHTNLNPDLYQTKKAIETIHMASRKDILVWQMELLETQKYFNKLKEQSLNEEETSQVNDNLFRQWADKTEERLSRLFGAMEVRLKDLDRLDKQVAPSTT